MVIDIFMGVVNIVRMVNVMKSGYSDCGGCDECSDWGA